MKLLCLILVLFVLSGSLPASSVTVNAASTLAPSYVSEIQKAVSLGIVPKTMQSNYTKNVTQKELYTFLNNCIRFKTGKYNTSWQKSVKYASSKAVVSRQQAAVIIYQAARLIDPNVKNYGNSNTLCFEADKLDKKFVQSHTDPASYGVVLCPYMDVAKTMKEYSQYDFRKLSSKNLYLNDAVDYVTVKSDCISGKKIMELTSDYRFRPRENTTKAEAVVAVYRLYNSIEGKAKYVKIESVGPNTIPSSLINKSSKLPDASNSKLPQWKGVNITNKAASTGAMFSNEDKNFHESEIKFLSDNGFNFVRVQFSFSTLDSPDYPKDMVNEVELRELDQLIEWGMKYDVHICLCMEGQPGMEKEQWPAEIMTGDFFTNTGKQELVKRYWQMLSKRYANIPNKYLSFNLMNEPEPPSDEVNTAVFKPIVEAVWHECPGRVIIADCTGCSCEGLAKMGVALSYHFYSPNIICYNGLDFMKQEFPYLPQTPQWPLVYLPGALYSGGNCNTITIEGSFSNGSIGIYAYDTLYDGDNAEAILNITADDQNILNTKVAGTEEPDSPTKKVQKEYTADIPEGTTKIQIKVNGWLRYGYIQIKQSGKKDINMYPHDLSENDFNAVSPIILVHDDGTYENNNSPVMKVDWNYLYQSTIKEHLDTAQRNNVGFMIGEFAPFGQALPKSTLLNYVNDVLNGLNSSGLPWCNGGFIGSGYIGSFAPYSRDYTFSKVPDSDLYVNQNLLSVYRKYTK